VQVSVGRTVPKGFLPVYSVDTAEEARSLVVATCSRGLDGKYYSDILAAARETEAKSNADIERQLDSLNVFADKLDAAHERLVANGLCKCKPLRRRK
jgi:uncharacterized membrane protein